MQNVSNLTQKVLEKRLAGESLLNIARTLNINVGEALDALGDALEIISEDLLETQSDLAVLELLRLDKLQEAIFDKAMEGDLQAVATILRIMERRARLLDLDLAQNVAQTEIVVKWNENKN